MLSNYRKKAREIWRIIKSQQEESRFEIEIPDENVEVPKVEVNRINTFWPYSDQYNKIVSEGHRKPPPSFGSPTFVWHIGIWQRFMSDEVNIAEAVRLNEANFETNADEEIISDENENTVDRAELLRKTYEDFDAHTEKFFREIGAFITHLQEKGRIKPLNNEDTAVENLKFNSPIPTLSELRQEETGRGVHRFKACDPQSLAFTLWWADSDKLGNATPNERPSEPKYSHIRVRVQVQTHLDHVTLSFFMDAAKPYNESQVYSTSRKSEKDFGYRREKIAGYLEEIKKSSETQIKNGYIEQDRVPEKGLNKQEAEKLLEVADYFYKGIWVDFMKSFDLHLYEEQNKNLNEQENEELSLSETRIIPVEGAKFAEFRGVVMSVEGVDTPINKERRESSEKLREATQVTHPVNIREQIANTGVGAFEVFDIKSNEPNTVLKSLWPFIRRITPWADYRDFVGCGVIDWRALYVTSLGASGSFYKNEEYKSRESEVENGLSEQDMSDGPLVGNHPIRYLVITKGEPHREQIGRFVERINSLGTMRLFALKSLSVVKNASTHIRLLGRELDTVLQDWGRRRKDIEKPYKRIKKDLKREELKSKSRQQETTDLPSDIAELLDNGADIELFLRRENRQSINSPREQELSDRRIELLERLVKDVEEKLIDLGAALDGIGQGGAGRLLYVINRANYHATEFERLFPTLEIGNIDGWINYGQFVERNLKPTFNNIRSTGERLISLRSRLQSITEMIQTSALIIETEATRSNTQVLRKIISNIYYLSFSLGLLGIIFTLNEFPENLNLGVFPGIWPKIVSVLILLIYLAFIYIRNKNSKNF